MLLLFCSMGKKSLLLLLLICIGMPGAFAKKIPPRPTDTVKKDTSGSHISGYHTSTGSQWKAVPSDVSSGSRVNSTCISPVGIGTLTGAYAVICDTVIAPPPETSHLRISLITCGPGFSEIFEVFGHTAIRIIDSLNKTDMVYNYGTFNGFEKNFELKFMQGKASYYLSVYPFDDFMQEYVEAKRSVSEQVLTLTDAQEKIFAEYLNWNAEPANRGYKYDFFYDNCATRIRDLFPETVSKDFKFGHVVPSIKNYTFRDIINERFYTVLWERFGINILLGSRIDKVMTDKDIMFLPDYLSLGVKGAVSNGQPVGANVETMLPGNPAPEPPVNGPLILNWCLAILTVLGLSLPQLKVLGKVMSMFMLIVTGLLGCLILVMWFGTNHQGCGNNFNILWALPTNLFVAFAKPKGKGKYAIIAIGLIIVSLLVHIIGIQRVIMPEFLPLFLALVYIYGIIYRNDK